MPILLTREDSERLVKLHDLASRNPILVTGHHTPPHQVLETRRALTIRILGRRHVYNVTFLVELRGEDLIRRLIMSATDESRLPSEDSVLSVAECLGFEGGLEAYELIVHKEAITRRHIEIS